MKNLLFSIGPAETIPKIGRPPHLGHDLAESGALNKLRLNLSILISKSKFIPVRVIT
jgi:hypothetical protein